MGRGPSVEGFVGPAKARGSRRSLAEEGGAFKICTLAGKWIGFDWNILFVTVSFHNANFW